MANRHKIKEIFEENAQRYDEWFCRNRELAESELEVLRLIRPRGIGIEIGVGTGFFAERLGVEFGIDLSLNMALRAKSRGIEVVCGDALMPPFRDSAFNYALLIATLCFTDNPKGLVESTSRLLKRGGIIIACIIPRDSPFGIRYKELAKKGHVFYSNAKFLTVAETREILKAAGCRIVRVYATLSRGFGRYRDSAYEIERIEEAENYGFVCLVASCNAKSRMAK